MYGTYIEYMEAINTLMQTRMGFTVDSIQYDFYTDYEAGLSPEDAAVKAVNGLEDVDD